MDCPREQQALMYVSQSDMNARTGKNITRRKKLLADASD